MDGTMVVRNPTTTLSQLSTPMRASGGHMLAHAAASNIVGGLVEAAVRQASRNMSGIARHSVTKALKQTKAVTRKDYSRSKGKSTDPKRHEELKPARPNNPVPKGKGHNKKAVGVTYTHPNARVPKWKKDRIRDYNKGNVYQTVLISQGARLNNSANQLVSARYPIQAPECPAPQQGLELCQSMIFTPFCSHYSGVHTTYFRYINATATGLIHATADTSALDVIQNKVDVGRHQLPSGVEATEATAIKYRGKVIDPDATPPTQVAAGASSADYENVFAWSDQLVKKNVVDLVFTASRNFPVKISVSMVRRIKPTSPYTLFTGDDAADLKQLTNDVGFTGMDYDTWRVEWSTEFTLPGLKTGKKPPTKSVNHTIVSNFLQTNSFNTDTTADVLDDAGQTLLGTGVIPGNQDAADGEHSGQYYFMIKYRKVRQPHTFTYHKVIDYSRSDGEGTGWGIPTAAVSMPALSQEGLDIPVHGGVDHDNGGQHHDGSPFSDNRNGDETRATFYVHGKIKTQWGFRHEEESIPSVMSSVKTSVDYNKPQSLCICPTIPSNAAFGLYEQSPLHQTLTKDTSGSGP